MKKLYISLILLFGFLAFVPTQALADSIGNSNVRERREQKCVKEKKKNLPNEYTGPNLKNMGERDALARFVDSGNKYFLDGKKVDGKVMIGYQPRFGHISCTECIFVNEDKYITTDVPPNSYLNYLPETQEIQVIDPSNEEYEILMANNYDGIPDFVIRGMLIALLLTLVIEGLLAAPFGWKFVGLVSLANIVTNPALNGIIWHYQITNTATILWLEATVVLIEWGIFSVFIRKNYGKLLLFAFVANLVSYLSGVFFPL